MCNALQRYFGIGLLGAVALVSCTLSLSSIAYATQHEWIPPTPTIAFGYARTWSTTACAVGEVQNGTFIGTSHRTRGSLSVAMDQFGAVTLLSYEMRSETR